MLSKQVENAGQRSALAEGGGQLVAESAKCPLCAGAAPLRAVMPIDAKTFRPTPHGRIYNCASCSFGFVHPRPPDTSPFYELDAYYTQGASHMPVVPPSLAEKVRTHLAWRFDKGESLVSILAGILSPGSTVVDIGCGDGALLRELGGMGHRAVGVERDGAATNEGLEVLNGSAESLPEIEPCDAVVFSHVLEHLANPVDALARAAKLLKPGGYLVCEVPNNEALIARQSRLAWEHLDVPRHLNFFMEASLATAVSQVAKPLRSYFAGYCRYFSGSFIATEQRIYDQLAAHGTPDAERNSDWASWKLLAKTALASPRDKYDSVGVIAIA